MGAAATLSLMNSCKAGSPACRRGHGAERIGAIFVDCGANAKRPKSCLIGSFPRGPWHEHPENLHSAVLHAEVEPPQAGFTDWVTIVRRSLPSNSLVAARTSVVLPSSGIGRRPGRFLRLPRHAVVLCNLQHTVQSVKRVCRLHIHSGMCMCMLRTEEL
jgi:hypothetical protein